MVLYWGRSISFGPMANAIEVKFSRLYQNGANLWILKPYYSILFPAKIEVQNDSRPCEEGTGVWKLNSCHEKNKLFLYIWKSNPSICEACIRLRDTLVSASEFQSYYFIIWNGWIVS